MGVDNKYFFLRSVANILVNNGLHRLGTNKYIVKLGLIYENKDGEFVITYYDIPSDACSSLFIKKYNKKFEEIESNEYYSDDDACDRLDCESELKESKLNKEILEIFTDIVSFINYKDKDSIIN